MTPTLTTIKEIKTQYPTGDSPVLASCSDQNEYICKYMRFDTAAYKLASELIGAQLAEYWGINTPKYCFVNIRREHWKNINTPINFAAPAIGFLKNNFAVDITDTNYDVAAQTEKLFEQLALIAVFDFWVGNEDRTLNNANMLYDVSQQQLISIDYGGIFNTNSFESEMQLLDEYESILYAEIASHIYNGLISQTKTLEIIKRKYFKNVEQSKKITDYCKETIPPQWETSPQVIENKTSQLFEKKWIDNCWDSFERLFNKIFKKK